MISGGEAQHLSLSFDAMLDHAVGNGWRSWHATVRDRQPEVVAKWLEQRFVEYLSYEDALELLPSLTGEVPPEERAQSAADLAELIEENDPGFAALMWEAVQESGRETGDAELMFEGASRLAAIEETYGDPLTAAEYFIEFLNWRRENGNASDPESVLTAFDEIIRLAELDGDKPAAAKFSYEQARFIVLVEDRAHVAELGEWTPGSPSFTSWDTV